MTNDIEPGLEPRSQHNYSHAVITTNDTPHLLLGWTPCDELGCVAPVARSLGSQYLCELHAGQILIPIQRKRVYANHDIPWDFEIGIARFDSPAYGWVAGWVYVRCDLSDCSATWVSRYAYFEPCPWCLSRAQNHSRNS